jgi:hypothetical protein
VKSAPWLPIHDLAACAVESDHDDLNIRYGALGYSLNCRSNAGRAGRPVRSIRTRASAAVAEEFSGRNCAVRGQRDRPVCSVASARLGPDEKRSVQRCRSDGVLIH